jgi:hypothetical protein
LAIALFLEARRLPQTEKGKWQLVGPGETGVVFLFLKRVEGSQAARLFYYVSYMILCAPEFENHEKSVM